jgi:pimeloyl-ACP methyl ester carboxylesterase
MTAFEQLELHEIELPQGTIRYRELGTGEPIVLVHGLLANGLLWSQVAPQLARDFRVIVPDWPLGAHTTPLRPDADRTPPALAKLIADFLSALELENVTLVGNDTGGALCQLVAVNHPERLGGLVLTPCDAYDNFLPTLFKPLVLTARVPGGILAVAHALRVRPLQRLPLTLGWLTKRPLEPALVDTLLRPLRTDRRIRRELAAILRGISSRHTLEAATRFSRFDKPVLIAWATEDRVFPLAHAERLAAAFPQGRLERIEDSYTFVPVDQPGRTAELIGAFARGLATVPTR